MRMSNRDTLARVLALATRPRPRQPLPPLSRSAPVALCPCRAPPPARRGLRCACASLRLDACTTRPPPRRPSCT
eukprot:3565463-Prymnesium_polylepis.1